MSNKQSQSEDSKKSLNKDKQRILIDKIHRSQTIPKNKEFQNVLFYHQDSQPNSEQKCLENYNSNLMSNRSTLQKNKVDFLKDIQDDKDASIITQTAYKNQGGLQEDEDESKTKLINEQAQGNIYIFPDEDQLSSYSDVSEQTVSNKTSPKNSSKNNSCKDVHIKQSENLEQKMQKKIKLASFVTQVNQPAFCSSCFVFTKNKQWIQVLIRITSQKIQLCEPKDQCSEKKSFYSLSIALKNLYKMKIYAIQSQNKQFPIKQNSNIIKLTLRNNKTAYLNSLLKIQNEEQLLISLKKSNKYNSIPLSFYIYGKILSQKLRYQGYIYSTNWEPHQVMSSLLLKRQLTAQQIHFQKCQEKKRKQLLIEKYKQDIKKQKSRQRAITKKQPTGLKRQQKLAEDKYKIYVKGFILKQSKHFKQWTKRYIEIDKYGLHSFSNLKQWASNSFIHRQDQTPKEQTFTIFRSNNVQQLWTRFETIDYDEISIDQKHTLEQQKGISKLKQQHKKMLVIKLKHDSWKTHQKFVQKTQLGIPITNFCRKNQKNWLFYIFQMME